MITYAELRAAQPDRWEIVAARFRTLGEAVASCGDGMAAAIDPIGTAWTGTAAIAALNRLTELRATLYAAYPGLVAVDQALSEFGVTLAQAKASLLAASEPKPGSIVQVDGEGGVTLAPISASPTGADYTDLESTRIALADAMRVADAADRDANERLGAVRFDVDASQPRPPLPPAGDLPGANAAWWKSLRPDQQLYLITTDPGTVIGLDGVPADARDRASRLMLHQQAATLAVQDQTLRAGTTTPATITQLVNIDGEITGLSTLEARLSSTESVRAYLLGLDIADGHAIVSISDPDRAANTLTFVPGVGSSLADIDSSLDAIDNIEDASADLQPSDTWSPVAAGDLATIGWVNYDAPPTVGSATGMARANNAAPNLSTFESGLRVTNEELGAHESVLGYSYGSVVVGAAAAQYGLDDDDIIMVASPGTTVKNAAALGIDPNHVWATAAPRDPIKLATNPINWIKHLFGAPAKSWFGMSPIDPAYGGRVFTSDAVPVKIAHTAYFNPGTSTVINVAKIALGDGGDVH